MSVEDFLMKLTAYDFYWPYFHCCTTGTDVNVISLQSLLPSPHLRAPLVPPARLDPQGPPDSLPDLQTSYVLHDPTTARKANPSCSGLTTSKCGFPKAWYITMISPSHLTSVLEGSTGKCHVTSVLDGSIGKCHVTIVLGWSTGKCQVTSVLDGSTGKCRVTNVLDGSTGNCRVTSVLDRSTGKCPVTSVLDRSTGKCHVTSVLDGSTG